MDVLIWTVAIVVILALVPFVVRSVIAAVLLIVAIGCFIAAGAIWLFGQYGRLIAYVASGGRG